MEENLFVGRDGQPITYEVGMAALRDEEATRVARDEVNGHLVSTVWLVIDHGFGLYGPIPFETMIFAHHEGECQIDQYQKRYGTEEAALQGHERAKTLANEAGCGLSA